ncbi:hypothetical protein DFH27DRAFT_24231 [Peziza echinospora]|nr:hypothetical protein DFH27DRAFT_24231 [Peziza echinospora]
MAQDSLPHVALPCPCSRKAPHPLVAGRRDWIEAESTPALARAAGLERLCPEITITPAETLGAQHALSLIHRPRPASTLHPPPQPPSHGPLPCPSPRLLPPQTLPGQDRQRSPPRIRPGPHARRLVVLAATSCPHDKTSQGTPRPDCTNTRPPCGLESFSISQMDADNKMSASIPSTEESFDSAFDRDTLGRVPQPPPTHRTETLAEFLKHEPPLHLLPTSTPPPPANGAAPVAPQSPTVRKGWLSNISSKFTAHSNTVDPQPPGSPTTEVHSQRQQMPGFLIATLRKLSVSGAQARGSFGARTPTNGGRCERVVMNRNATRDKCRIAELDGVKLKKVAFCVDVEVSVAPPIKDEPESPSKKRNEKDEETTPKPAQKEATTESKEPSNAESNIDAAPAQINPKEAKDEKPTPAENMQEKLPETGDAAAPGKTETTTASTDAVPNGTGDSEKSAPANPVHTAPKPRRRPTTDVTRIYKRCCQLRETPVLPIIAEQLSTAAGKTSLDYLDLSSHSLHLSDALVLSDFLALAPVTKLDLENCSLTDESLRVILSGLLAVKQPSEYTRATTSNRNGSKEDVRRSGSSGRKSPIAPKTRGMVEWLSLRNNPQIGREGWRYISLFLHMSRSLKALDVSMIQLPRNPPIHSPGRGRPPFSQADSTGLFCKALSERLAGVGLQELAMNRCELNTEQLRCIVNAVRKGLTRRLDLEGNHITDDGLIYLGQWIKEGTCEGISLSSNDLQDHIDILAASLHENAPLQALCLANCNLDADSLSSLMPALTVLKNFRLLDLSHNPNLFSTQPDALPLLRRYLPKLPMLKKLQLAHTYMTPDHAIALCEILPDIKTLAHFNIVDNPLLVPSSQYNDPALDAMNREGSEEEGAALYTALAAAVKVSRSIVRMDIDPPPPDSGEVIKGLARKVVAFCLRNLEATELYQGKPLPAHPEDAEIPNSESDPEDSESDEDDDDENAERKDHLVVGGTGVVKALGVCLGNKPHLAKSPSTPVFGNQNPLDVLPSESDYAAPDKANDMSKLLLMRARKIKARIQPALERAAGGEIDGIRYRKLLFLDDTLYRVINRFEEEYPECRITPAISPPPKTLTMSFSTTAPHSANTESKRNSAASPPQFLNSTLEADDDHNDDSRIRTPALSRQPSDISLHSRVLDYEEGRMHKLATFVRKGLLAQQNPSGEIPVVGGGGGGGEGATPPPTCISGIDVCENLQIARTGEVLSPDIQRLRNLVEDLGGDEIRQKVVEQGGAEGLIKKLEGGAEGLMKKLEGALNKEAAAPHHRRFEEVRGVKMKKQKNGQSHQGQGQEEEYEDEDEDDEEEGGLGKVMSPGALPSPAIPLSPPPSPPNQEHDQELIPNPSQKS